MVNLRYIIIVSLFLVTIIIVGVIYSGEIFNFSHYKSIGHKCLDMCPYKLKCAGFSDLDMQQRCFAQCQVICHLNPFFIPDKYDESYLMAAFYGTA